MGRIVLPVTPGLAAAQRVAAQVAWPRTTLGFPTPSTADGGDAPAVGSWLDATHVRWDGDGIGPDTQALLEEIAADPARLPEDVSGLDQNALRALYPNWANRLPKDDIL